MPRSFDLHALRPAGFSLRPLAAADDGCWWEGHHDASGTRVVVRVAPGVPFGEAVVEAAGLIDLMDAAPPGVAPPVAVVVCGPDGRAAAATASAAAGFMVASDPAVASAVTHDDPVDVCAVYVAVGAQALDGADIDPATAAERLASIAAAVDALAAGNTTCGGRSIAAHGAIDAPCLRIGPDGPQLLGVGFDRLDGGRRSRLDTPGPWRLAAPETCLPPGEPGPRTDQYMLAAAWATARRKQPLHADSDPVGLARTILSTPPRLDDLPAEERTAIARAVAIPVDQRFATCGDFAAAVMAAVGVPVAVAPAGAAAAQPADQPRPPALPERERSTARVTDTSRVPIHSSEQASPQSESPRRTTAAAPEPEPIEPVAVRPTPPLVPSPPTPVAVPAPAGLPPVPVLPVPVPPAPAPAAPAPAPMPAAPARPAGVAPSLACCPYKTGDVILPGYRLVSQLGKGGFGEVWKATAPGGMGVAIKVIANLGRREGAREYRALRTVKDIRHAHIVPMFGVWLKTSDGRLLDEEEAAKVGGRVLNTDPGQRVTIDPQAASPLEQLELVIAMGLGDQTLFDRLQRSRESEQGGLDVAHLLIWMRQAALAIDHFNRGSSAVEHTQSAVQHCDIKPQNMLLVGNAVQVCDFGLARVQGEVRATANNLLSIAYAAPEMTQRPYDPSPATDQYSLAVTYYELRTGRLPYAGPVGEAATGELSALELLRAKTEGRLDLGGVSPGEERVLRRGLATDPSERFGSCEEFIDALEFAIDRDNAAETAPADAAAGIPWTKTAVLAGGTLVAMGLAAALFLPGLWPWPPPPNYLAQAREAFVAAGTGQSPPDAERLGEARKLAEQARTGGDEVAATKLLAEIDAVEKICALVRAAANDESRIDAAAESLRTLPPTLPAQLRTPLETAVTNQIDLRKKAAVAVALKALLAAVAENGTVDQSRLDAAAGFVRRAKDLGAADAASLADAVAAIRAAAPVTASDAAEPPGLDDAVAAIDKASSTLPDAIRSRLGRRLATLLVGRSRQRLKDYDPATTKTTSDAMRRAIEDSAADATAAARIDPSSWQARGDQGRCAAFLGQYAAAVKQYSAALDLATTAGAATEADRNDLLSRRAFALLKERRFAEAAADYLVFRAGDAKLRLNLWDMHRDAIDAGRVDDALQILALLEPRMRANGPPLPQLALGEVLTQTAWLHACGPNADEASGRRAIALATEALEMAGIDRTAVLDALAAGHARTGQWDDAVARIGQALEATTDAAEKLNLEKRAAAYRQKQPWGRISDDAADEAVPK
jgi:serine/threonine protein kinase